MTKEQGRPGDSIPGDAKTRMERVLRLHQEIDSLKEMIREVYGEEKDAGGDKTAMGSAVSIIRKRSKDSDKFDNQQGMVDLYLTAFAGTSHTHAYARDEITEPQVAPQPVQMHVTETVADPVNNDATTSPDRAEGIADGQPIQEIPAAVEAPRSTQVVDVGGSGDAANAGSTPAPASNDAGSRADRILKIRPLCQHPTHCMSSGGKTHCSTCRKVAAETQGAA